MTKRFFAGAALLAISIVVFSLLSNSKKPPEKKPQAESAQVVEIIRVERQDIQFSIRSQGTVEPRTQTRIASELTGKVVSVSDNFVVGGFFQQDEVLLQIDPSDYVVAVKRAEAGLASRQAQLAQEVARAEQAQSDWTKLDGRRGSASDLVLRKPQLAEAQANVLSAQADLIKAKRDLERTKIRAPYAGLVRSKQIGLGQYVTQGSVVGEGFAIEGAEVRLPVTDRDLAFLDLPQPGQRQVSKHSNVLLRTQAAGQELIREASIVRTEGVIDDNTRVSYLVARLDDPYSVLNDLDSPVMQVGSFVTAQIKGIEVPAVVAIPAYVLRNDQSVLVVDENSQLEIRSVEVIRADTDQAIISAGLEEGDRVILTSIDLPIPGTRLMVVNDESGEGEPVTTATGQLP